MAKLPLVKQFERRLEALIEEYATWLTGYKDIADYVVPSRGRFLDRDTTPNDGKKRHSNVIDSTAIRALNVLGAGMQSGLTSPARPWYKLGLADKDLMEYTPVKLWLETVRKRMLSVFAGSNYYNATHNTYIELGGFGTGAKLIEEDMNSVIRCYPFTVGEYFLIADYSHRISGMYRVYKGKAVNVVEDFGEDNVSSAVRRMAEDNKDEWVPIVHVIEKNPEANPQSLFSDKKAWRSVYYEKETREGNMLLRNKGYDEFPLTAPRWAVTGTETYGKSPGWEALGDVKMLQKMQQKSLKALDKLIDPPVNAPSTLKNQGVTVIPGGVNWVNSTDGNQSFSATYQINPDFMAIENKIGKVQEQIKEAFYVDLFLMLASSDRRQITATEVAERHEEKLLMVGPVIERIQPEMLDRDIDRVFGIMERNGLFPEPPRELEGMNIEVEYISLLSQAQKLVGKSSVESVAAFAADLSGIEPEVLDVIDFDATVEEYAEMSGSPPRMIRSKEEREARREARRQQIAAQQQLEAMSKLAPSAKALSETDMSTDNALTRISGG